MNTVEFKFKNGDKVRDKITKAEAVIIECRVKLGGEKRYGCEPEVIKGELMATIIGKSQEGRYLTEERLELVIENFLEI